MRLEAAGEFEYKKLCLRLPIPNPTLWSLGPILRQVASSFVLRLRDLAPSDLPPPILGTRSAMG